MPKSNSKLVKELFDLGSVGDYNTLNIPRGERRDKTETNTAIAKTVYELSPKYESTRPEFGYAAVNGDEMKYNKNGTVNTGYLGCHQQKEVRYHL